MSCGVGCRLGSDLALLGSGVGWRLQLPLDPEPGNLHAEGVALEKGEKKKKKKKKKKRKRNHKTNSMKKSTRLKHSKSIQKCQLNNLVKLKRGGRMQPV